MNVIVLLVDGVRADTLRSAIDAGALPALARLRAEGGLYDVTSTFPTVTGPAYAPFLLGRFPGGVGLPGIRWYDRGRTVCRWPDYARSYVGYQLAFVDRDLDPRAPTIFELEPNCAGALSVITRGLPRRNRIMALNPISMWRAARVHFLGGPDAMLAVDRDIGAEVIERAHRTRYVFAAFGGADKASHAVGQSSPVVTDALRIVDETVASLRADLERRGQWDTTRLWISSDHGHSDVTQHEDLAAVIEGFGHRVLAHPQIFRRSADVAVMVSGNAMAHVYVDISRRDRFPIRDASARAQSLVSRLAQLPSIDLVIVSDGPAQFTVMNARGAAGVDRLRGLYSYTRRTGDPLGLGADHHLLSREAAHEATLASEYPDAIVQIAELASAARAGDIILSAAPGWDFRARFEPTPHHSTHGSLRRAHMLVPLLSSHPVARTPRRTTDIFASALAALGHAAPVGLDGESFV